MPTPFTGGTTIRYRGLNRCGIAMTGVSSLSAAELAEKLFANGCRSVTIEDVTGVQIGGISRFENGNRNWWGER